MPDLLIVYEMNPEKVFSFVVNSKDQKYELMKQAHRLLVNINEDNYPSEVVELVADMQGLGELKESMTPLQISGDFLVVHCGFVL